MSGGPFQFLQKAFVSEQHHHPPRGKRFAPRRVAVCKGATGRVHLAWSAYDDGLDRICVATYRHGKLVRKQMPTAERGVYLDPALIAELGGDC